jgi:mRNA interferase RelE/StbE
VNKLAGSANTYRIRVGDYRIVYEVDMKEQVITVARVRHRRDAYR